MQLGKFAGKVVRRIYERTRRDFGVSELFTVKFSSQDDTLIGRRLNLVIPAISQKREFGGVATAVRIFSVLMGAFDSARVVVLNETRRSFEASRWPNWSTEADKTAREITFLGGRDPILKVTENDVFIATFWTTAVLVSQAMEFQGRSFRKNPGRFIYLIQDFEPGFYAWSDRYAYAESTYKLPQQTIAVFNTELLAEYFHLAGIRFSSEYVFEPAFNSRLRELRDSRQVVKERSIVVYGRPTTPRNCFDVLVDGLKLWANAFPSAKSWSVVSVGEPHANVPLSKGVLLRARAKLTLEDYADHLAKAWVGISLMLSPHPSYPPLDMAEFGCWVITNKFANKDLASRAPNIISLNSITAESIADALKICCESYRPAEAVVAERGTAFKGQNDEFPFVAELLGAIGVED